MNLSALKVNIFCVLFLGVGLASAIDFKNLEHGSTLVRRRMGVQHNFPQVDCPQDVCGTLLYSVGQTLFVMAPPCKALHHAEKLIDAANDPKLKDAKIKEQLIALAKMMVQAEKNTPDDWSKNPPTKLNTLYCHDKPKYKELEGLFFKQAPNNDPNFFFDPATHKTVKLDEIPTTRPLGSSKDTKTANSTSTTPPKTTEATSSTENTKKANSTSTIPPKSTEATSSTENTTPIKTTESTPANATVTDPKPK